MIWSIDIEFLYKFVYKECIDETFHLLMNICMLRIL